MEQDSIADVESASDGPWDGNDDPSGGVCLVRLATAGPDETRAAAAALAAALNDGDLLVLTGDLGAGKTCFTQGLGRGLGIDDRLTSPTFTLANRYHGRLTLNHLDVYRLDSLAETMDLGLTELLEDGVTVIEWGDRIHDVLPVDHLIVSLRYPEVAVSGSPVADGAIASETDWDDPELNRRVIELRAAAGRPSGWAERGLPELLDEWRIRS